MIYFIMGIIVLYALFGIIFLAEVKLWLIFTMLLGVIVIAVSFLLRKKIKRPVSILIEILSVATAVFFMFHVSVAEAEYPMTEYADNVSQVEDMIIKKSPKARKEIEELEKKYGTNDTILGLYAYQAIVEENWDEACIYLDEFEDRISVEFYSRLEKLYLMASYSGDPLRDLYIEAAKNQPYWQYAQKMAGIACYERDNHKGAEYYLIRALELNPSDPQAFYYMGVIKYDVGQYKEAAENFKLALECGADKELQSWILWYIQQMTD